MLRNLKEIFKSLGDTYFWFIVGIVATLQQSLIHMKLVIIWKDRDGDWFNKREGFTLFSPIINVESFSEIKARVQDLWLFDYEIQDSDIIFDVGAGIGDDLIYLSKLCSNSISIFAIEANPITYRCLEKTIKHSNLINVHPLMLACCDEEKEVKISSSKQGHLANNIFSRENLLDFETVRGTTIDNIANEQNVNKINFIKMNIEGAETIALKGAINTMKSGTKFVVSCHDFKYHEGQGTFFKTFDDVNKIFKENNLKTFCRSYDRRREVPYYVYVK